MAKHLFHVSPTSIFPFAFAFVWVFSLPASAYNVNNSGSQIKGWSDTSLPVPWYFNPNGFTDVSEADAEREFQASMWQWTQQPCTRFRARYMGRTTTLHSSDRKNVLLFDYLSAGSATTAITYTLWGGSTGFTDADIVFRRTKPFSVNPNSNQLDLRGTATHEIGHFLGLGHSGTSSATMYGTTSTGPSQRRFLHADDIQGVCFIYPATPMPQGTLGLLCGSDASGATCQSGLLCAKGTRGSFCQEPCNNNACTKGKCIALQQGGGYCGCNEHSDCPTSDFCLNHRCIPRPNACAQDTDCTNNLRCVNGSCVVCRQDTDCTNNQVCRQGQCVTLQPPCTSDANCPSTERCNTSTGVCVPNTPPPCTSDANCPSTERCDTSTGKCVPRNPSCTQNSDCEANARCDQGRCIQFVQIGERGSVCGASAGGQFCDDQMVCVNKSGQPAYCLALCQNGGCPDGGKCLRTTLGTQFCACDGDSDCNANQFCFQRSCFQKEIPCTKDADCSAPSRCLQGRCIEPAPCTQDNECPPNEVCTQGRCQSRTGLGFGQPCTQDIDCISQLCAPTDSQGQRYCSAPCSDASPCPPAYLCEDSTRGKICRIPRSPSCQKDADCAEPTPICQAGRCISRPPCLNDRECTAPLLCVQGRCVSPSSESSQEPAPETNQEATLPEETTTDAKDAAPPEITPTEQPAKESLTPTDSNAPIDDDIRPKGCGCQSQDSFSSWIGLFVLFLIGLLRRRPLHLLHQHR